MTEAHRGDLSYGHLGEATYFSETREWQFGRVLDRGRSLKPLGDSRPALPSTKTPPGSWNVQPAGVRNKQIGKLIYSNPVLAPAASFLPPLVQVSETIHELVSTYDPIIGELISFGKAINLDNHYSGARAVDIAAIAGGHAGEAVRLIQINKQQLKWKGEAEVDFSAYFTTQGLEGGEQGIWVSNGSPIQQLCFSNGVDGLGNWLAVRCAVVITILRPLIRRSRMSPHVVPPGSVHSSSHLDPNPFIQLSIKQTGGGSFVGVSFNPWNDHQFMVLDLNGRWSIWNIEGQHQKRNTWAVEAGLSGFLENQKSHLEAVSEDGWGVILWAANPDIVIVARRSAIAIYDVKRATRQLDTSNLIFLTQSDWILDIKRSSRSPRDVYVLTSTRIFWLRLGIDMGDGDKTSQPAAKILLSWWHSRSHEDTSLHILLDDGQREDTMLLLYSRITKLITGFIFNTSSTQLPQSISDPFLTLPDSPKLRVGSSFMGLQNQDYDTSTSTLTLTLVDRTFPQNIGLPRPGHWVIDNASAFYQVFTLRNDLSVTDHLYVDLPAREKTPQGLLTRASHIPPLRSSTRVVDDSFIVADGVQPEGEEYLRYSHLPSGNDNEHQRQSREQDDDPWTVNMEWLAGYVEKHSPFLGQPALGHKQFRSTESLDGYLIALGQNVQVLSEDQQTGVETLLESSPFLPSVDDLDMTSQSLQSFIEGISEESGNYADEQEASFNVRQRPRISSLLPPAISQALQGYGTNCGDLLLLSIYDRLVKYWVTPLVHEVPEQVRVKLGKHLKIVALHLYLASYGILKTQFDTPTIRNSLIEQAPRDRLVLTVRRKSSMHSLDKRKGKENLIVHNGNNATAEEVPGPTPSLNQGSLSLPTPNPTPSTSSLSSNQLVENAAYLRLSALTTLDYQSPPSESVIRLLGHWKMGTNPSEYDWKASQNASQLPTDVDVIEDEHKKKQKEREEKRQKRRRENTLQSSSQSVPSLVQSSQAPTSPNLLGSSQVTLPFLQPSSQPSFSYVPNTPRIGQTVSNKAPAKKKVKTPGFR